MLTNKLNYREVTKLTGIEVIKSGPGGLFSVTITGNAPGGVTIYDDTDITGDDVLFSTGSTSVGDIYRFGGYGVAANKGITVWSFADVVVAYT